MMTLPSSFSRITVPRLAQPDSDNKKNKPVNIRTDKYLAFSMISPQ
jgi:hypothetical protein